jgi:chromosome segregation ATPase
VTFSFSNAFEFTNLAEVKELRSTTYGNSLIETISLTLANAGSIDEVKRLLNDLLYKLNKDQQDADRAWEKLNKQLTEKIARLKREIQELDAQIALDVSEKKKFEGLKVQSEKNLVQYRAQLNHNQEALALNEANRKKDAEEYRKSVEEHNDIINAIEAVLKELRKLVGSISGQGKPAHVEELAAEKRDREYAAKLKKSFVQITGDEEEAQLFVEMATTADQNALKKLIGLLTQLQDSTKQSLNDDEKHEARSLATYKKLKEILTEDNKKLDASINEQTRNLNRYKSEIARLSKKIADEKALRKSKKVEKKTTEKQRQDAENQYRADKAERASERKVIERLQKIVKDRLDNMSKFLRDSTGSF